MGTHIGTATAGRGGHLRRRACVPLLAAGLMLVPAVAGCSTSGSSTDATSSSAAPARWSAPFAPTDQPMSKSEAAMIDAIAKKALAASPDKAPGMIIGVWDPQKGFYIQSYGDAERGGAKMTPDTHMYVGSITKTATATAILRLVDQGKFKLDDTVEAVAHELATKFPAIAQIPIKHLLA